MEHGLKYKGKEVELSHPEMLAVLMCVTFVDATFSGRDSVMGLIGLKLAEYKPALKMANLRMMAGLMGSMSEEEFKADKATDEVLKRMRESGL